MTRKDYPLLSRALANVPASITDPYDRQYMAGIDDASHAIAEALAKDNPHGFDKERFLRDCGTAECRDESGCSVAGAGALIR